MSEAVAYLESELVWLNLLLQREILRLRASYQMSLDEFRGLYVSDEQVDAHLAAMVRDGGSPGTTPDPGELTARASQLRDAGRGARAPEAPWSRLVRRLELDPLEEDILLLAAALEYDLKYASIYAYLNNDITKRFPTVDLSIRLFGHGVHDLERFRVRLRRQARLVRTGMLTLRDGARAGPTGWRVQGFSVRPAVWDFLIGAPPALWVADGIVFHAVDHAPAPRDPTLDRAALEQLAQCALGDQACVVALVGREGDGRQALARAVGRKTKRPLITVALADLEQRGQATAERLCEIEILVRMHRPIVFVRCGGFEGEAPHFVERLRGAGCVTLLACDRQVVDQARTHVDQVVECAGLTRGQRHMAWSGALGRAGVPFEPASVEGLTDRFVLNVGEIDRVVRVMKIARPRRDETSEHDLLAAARMVTRTNLGSMALRVPPRIGWDDLVLPDATRRRLATIAGAIEHRRLVFDQWGFGRSRLSCGGLSILFSGSSGTGKTAAASAIAQRAGFDLYKIDLSAVVSKYIGETEKNLDRIFSAQHVENAIVFFDEADALFGKRSEVKEAHDRFANIEIGYLLQKLEAHDGVVILASNLSSNIDDAFSRRIDFSIEFPFPDAALRARLWRGTFPPDAPLDDDVHFEFLAQKFELAGGDIRNVATGAAFLAAQNGGTIGMEQIVQALDEQLIKQGIVRTAAQFGPYHEFVRPARRDRAAKEG